METTDFDQINWNRLTEAEAAELEARLEAELSSREKADLDLMFWGRTLLFKAKHLSWKVNTEVIATLARWLDDPDMLRRHEIRDERVYDWAALKREQRSWDRVAQAERLRLYWEAVRRKRALLSSLGETSQDTSRKGNPIIHDTDDDFVGELLAPFCPEAEAERTLAQEFADFMGRHVVDRLPWRQLMVAEIVARKEVSLGTLAAYTSAGRREVVAKFSALLHLDHDGTVIMQQDHHFEDPVITIPDDGDLEEDAVVQVKDRDGTTRTVDLGDVNTQEKMALIEALKEGELLCS